MNKPITHCPYCGSQNMRMKGGWHCCGDCWMKFLIADSRQMKPSKNRYDGSIRDPLAVKYEEMNAKFGS